MSILWTRPFEQKSTHRINLFIVFYADFLLILQYLYCMILTADHLPFRDNTILSNLAQIGVVRYDSFPCIPLLFKAICAITFCFTLRQEQQEQIRASILTTNSIQIDSNQRTILKCFHFGVNVLTHIWVTIILLTMFIYAIYGNEVNFLKFCYMVYVLVFLTSYQLSLHIWRKMMYALWMLVIFSSMASLILIYTYQFDGFDYFWEHYLGVDKHMWVFLFSIIINLNKLELIEFKMNHMENLHDFTGKLLSGLIDIKRNICSFNYFISHFWLLSRPFNSSFSIRNTRNSTYGSRQQQNKAISRGKTLWMNKTSRPLVKRVLKE